MYVILRILKHMALVDFVTLPTYREEQCAVGLDRSAILTSSYNSRK